MNIELRDEAVLSKEEIKEIIEKKKNEKDNEA
jgi:hypothetical protein